ncbi:MAG: sulfatase-like hydrolase/transferase [Pseudomonadota bacterium]
MNANVLLIVIDQFRSDLIQGALADHVELPNLRALQREAVSFNNHYTVTSPCGPSRASLLTGLYAMNHRSVHNGSPLDASIPNLANQMRTAGYEPLLFGYTDTSTDPRGRHPNDPDLKSYEGLLPGFAEIVRMRLETSVPWLADLNAKGYALPENYWELYRSVGADGGPGEITDPTLYRAEDSDTAFLTNATIKELAVRKSDAWFATLTYIRPHPPFAAPAPYNRMYDPAAVPAPVRPLGDNEMKQAHPVFAAEFSGPSNGGLFIGHDGFADRLSEEQIRELRAVYLGLATEVDHSIGRLFDMLKETGQYDDTLIIVTADHGESLGDHHVWAKHMPFEQSFRIPLIVKLPGSQDRAGAQVDTFTESVDVTPSIVDWAGGEQAPGFDGKSLLPLVRGEAADGWRDHVFAEASLGDPLTQSRFQTALNLSADEANYAILWKGDHKLVHFNGGLPPLLFNLAEDPDEANNLAKQPDYADLLRRLMAAMLDHRMTHANHTLSRMMITKTGIQSS